MIKFILKFVCAVGIAVLFNQLMSAFFLTVFAELAHFFGNLSWGSWFSLAVFRVFLIPVGLIVLHLVGILLVWLVRGSIVKAVLPVMIFIWGMIVNFKLLFLFPIEHIIDDIGHGFWYYLGAALTYLSMLVVYIYHSWVMLAIGYLSHQGSQE